MLPAVDVRAAPWDAANASGRRKYADRSGYQDDAGTPRSVDPGKAASRPPTGRRGAGIPVILPIEPAAGPTGLRGTANAPGCAADDETEFH